jgi:thiol-disulfide isomerase/thioredoxin
VAAAARRRVRWVAPLAIAVTAVVVLALIVAVHATEHLQGTTTIESAGFSQPNRTTPVSFSLPVLQPAFGETTSGAVTMASLAGRPIVLNMWSSSCSVCKGEMPAVESVARKSGDAVQFVGVDTIDQKQSALAFLRRYHVTYLQLFDPSEVVGSGYAIPGLPVTVFVSGRGKVVGEYLGALNAKTLTHYLTSLFGVRLPAR